MRECQPLCEKWWSVAINSGLGRETANSCVPYPETLSEYKHIRVLYIYIYCAYDFICVYVRIYIHLFTVCNVHVYVHRYVSLPIFTLGHSVYILNIHFTWHSLSFWDERKTAGILLQKLGPQSCCSLSHPAESSQYPPTKNSGKWRSIS